MAFFTAAAIGLSLVSSVFGSKSKKEQKKAAYEKQKAMQVRNIGARRRMIQEFNTAQAAAAAEQVALGGGGVALESSGYQGVRNSVQTQILTNLYENNSLKILDQNAQAYMNKASKYATYGSYAAAGAQLMSGFSDITPKTPTATVDTSAFGPPKASEMLSKDMASLPKGTLR